MPIENLVPLGVAYIQYRIDNTLDPAKQSPDLIIFLTIK